MSSIPNPIVVPMTVAVNDVTLPMSVSTEYYQPISLQTLEAEANGEYTAPKGTAWNEAHIDVPNSYTAADEGKVVSGGALVAQTGDIIFCSNRGTGHADHVGIVEETDGETVISIDGNTVDPSGVFQKEQGGAVARRARCRQDPVIVGYAATGKLICAKE